MTGSGTAVARAPERDRQGLPRLAPARVTADRGRPRRGPPRRRLSPMLEPQKHAHASFLPPEPAPLYTRSALVSAPTLPLPSWPIPVRLVRLFPVVCALAVLPAALFAHDIPTDVRVQSFLKPEGTRLRLLVRLPIASTMNDIEWPIDGARL